MSSEWRIVRLGDVSNIRRGSSPRPIVDYMAPSGMPWVKISDATETKSRFIKKTNEFIKFEGVARSVIVKEGDLILSNSGTAGLPKFMAITACVHDGWQFFSDLNGIDKDFLYYTLLNIRCDLLHNAHDSTMKNLTLDMVRDAKVNLPPLIMQKKISRVLTSLDEKIELNHQINQTLEHMAQAIFQSWFVDFEPVKAKIAAREDWLARQAAQSDAHDDAPQFSSPVCYAHEFADAAAPAPATQADLETFMNRAAMCAISGKTDADLDAMPAADYQRLYHTASLFPDELVESELGEIPKGWEVKALDQIANYQNGLALQKFRPEDGEDYLPVVKIAQLKKGYADGEERASANITEKCIIDTGDVVFSWSGSLEVDIWCGGRAALNQHLFKVTSNTYPRWFYYLYTRHHLEDFQRIAKDKAVTMGHIKREHLSSAYCAISKNDLLGECDKAISALVDKTILNRVEINNLENIRDSLLPKLLSGELNCSTLTD